MRAVAPTLDPEPSRAPRLYYGWIVLLVAAVAMVGTLPGRTQGLGLITEPLLADLGISRVRYAELNFWATILGSAGAIGVGQLIDRLGSLIVLTLVVLALGLVGAMAMGLGGGLVMVLFFSVWPRVFGRRHLGTIQG